jgi:alpha-N-arabinofuranosidase
MVKAMSITKRALRSRSVLALVVIVSTIILTLTFCYRDRQAATEGTEVSATVPVATPTSVPAAAATSTKVPVPSPTPIVLPQGARARIDIDAAQLTGPVNKLLFGNSVNAVGRGNGILDTHHQLDPAALRMIRNLRPSILRFASQPIFEDGVGDLLDRPPSRCGWDDPCTGEWEEWRSYEYGIDDHMALLEAIEANGHALITIGYPYALEDTADPESCVVSSNSNLSQMVKRAMAWVAYMNGDPSNTMLIGADDEGFDWKTVGYWAQQRANNGHPEPYEVRYWEIGDEVYYHADHITPERYGHDYLAFQDAMKQVDPSIIVGASAGVSASAESAWNTPLLSIISPHADALVVHLFYPGEVYDSSAPPAVMAAATQADDDLAQLRQLLATTTDRANEIGLIVGAAGIDYAYCCGVEIPDSWNMLSAGVYGADLIGMLVERNTHYKLELAIQNWLHGASFACDIHFDWETGERYARPDYYALQMWTNHFGDVLVKNTVTCDAFDSPEAHGRVGPIYNVRYLAAHASISEDRLYLLVINRHLADSIPTAIRIDGFTPQSDAAVYTLSAPSYESTNEQGSHDTVVITGSSISDTSRGFIYVFPAHSVTVLELSSAGQ